MVAIGALVTVLAGCSGGSDAEPSVDWVNYAPTVKQRIDKAGADKDCTVLQAEFDQADANNTIQQARTGDNNADLMDYIDQKLIDAGCS